MYSKKIILSNEKLIFLKIGNILLPALKKTSFATF
jgi:hypothetical protein